MMESTKTKRVWHKGPPPHVGWWNASTVRDKGAWRWWDERWSAPFYPNTPPPSGPLCPTATPDAEWNDFYPENARVPRIDQRKQK